MATPSDKYDGWYADVPSYGQPMQVRFNKRALANHPSVDSLPAGWEPLATLGSEESQVLAINAAGAIGMFEHETGKVVPVAVSLDVFLANLGKTRAAAKPNEPIVGIGTLRKVVERGIGLTDGRITKAKQVEIQVVLEELEPLLANMPSEEAVHGGEHHGLPSRALYSKGRMLRALKRFDEALDTLENAVIDGERRVISFEIVCDLLLFDLNRPERVVALCDSQKEEPFGVSRTLALALFQLGKLDRAAALLQSPNPKVQAARREAVSKFAKTRDLDATALLAKI